MGGSRFNGLALVHELVKYGYDVTILNRGASKAQVPHSVRRLYADRTNHEQLREVLGHEEFDVIQDISCYSIDDLRPMVEMFRGRTGHYIFASSTVIYGPTKVLPIRESHPVVELDRRTEYVRQKLLCEAYLFENYRAHGFAATTVPFSMVMGPNNVTADREQRMFKRLLLGRPVLIPGSGTTLGQIGHVDDGACALRMLMLRPQTFGKRYNLTGKDYWSEEGYVDIFAEIVGVKPDKVFVPPDVMDDIYADRLESSSAGVGTGAMKLSGDSASVTLTRNPHMVNVSGLIQRLAPWTHHWNESTFFSVDRLWEDVGFRPAYTFAAAVEQTYEWFRREKRAEALEFNFAWEDELLTRIRG
jgi:nucleoside-diphosphate-sugar epimerase